MNNTSDGFRKSTPHNDVTFQWEPWSKIIAEALPMLHVYWQTGGVLFPNELPWDPDLPLSFLLEKTGRLRIFTARSGQRLIGLNSFNVGTTLFRKSAVVATGIILYLLPSERKASRGVQLIKGPEDGLAEMGVDLICYLPSSTIDLSRLLRMCGYKQQGSSFEKLLRGRNDEGRVEGNRRQN